MTKDKSVIGPSIEPPFKSDEAEKPKPKKAPPKRKPRRKKTPEQVLAEKHGASPEQVEKYRVEDGAVICLINWGIKGTKKYKTPLAEFSQRASFFK